MSTDTSRETQPEQQPGTHRVLVRITWDERVSYEQDIEIDVPDGFEEAGGEVGDLVEVDDQIADLEEPPEGFTWPEGYKTNWLDRADMSETASVDDRDINEVYVIE